MLVNPQEPQTVVSETTAVEDIASELKSLIEPARARVIRPAEGFLKYPYLIPSGYYKQMWDWDAFFMGCHFVTRDQPEYLKYWALNQLSGVDEEGYVSGCTTTTGPRPIFGRFSMKPFLSQGAWLAAESLNDVSWLQPHYETLERVLDYRDRTQLDSESGLYFWENAMQSGADNNPALNYFMDDKRSFLACDASTFQLREFLAQAKIADALGHHEDAAKWNTRASTLKANIHQRLWCPDDCTYYNVNRETGQFYRRVSYSSFIPLIQKVAPAADGKKMIQRYLLDECHMKARFGFRSLSKADPDYNNQSIIDPFSNWQGPVWPIANYLYSIGLHHYGFHEANTWLASAVGSLLLKDLQTHGTMHETYHADTGEPLAPSHDHRDEEGNILGFVSWNLCIENLLEGVTADRWMLLEI